MKRRNKIYFALFVIIFVACIWAFVSAAVITKNFKRDIINSALEKEELKVRGLFVTETKEGQKYWEVYAEEGQVDSESKVVLLYQPIGNFYDKDNNVIMSFKSDKGTYQEDNKKIILYDNILIVYKDGTYVKADKLIWAGKDEDTVALGHVKIIQDGKVTTSGDKAILSNQMTHFSIEGQTKTEITDAAGSKIEGLN